MVRLQIGVTGHVARDNTISAEIRIVRCSPTRVGSGQRGRLGRQYRQTRCRLRADPSLRPKRLIGPTQTDQISICSSLTGAPCGEMTLMTSVTTEPGDGEGRKIIS
jgi:hypothetical protein